MDRGTRGINFILQAMVFNVVPTALEVALVAGAPPGSCAVLRCAGILFPMIWQVGPPGSCAVMDAVLRCAVVLQPRTWVRREMRRAAQCVADSTAAQPAALCYGCLRQHVHRAVGCQQRAPCPSLLAGAHVCPLVQVSWHGSAGCPLQSSRRARWACTLPSPLPPPRQAAADVQAVPTCLLAWQRARMHAPCAAPQLIHAATLGTPSGLSTTGCHGEALPGQLSLLLAWQSAHLQAPGRALGTPTPIRHSLVGTSNLLPSPLRIAWFHLPCDAAPSAKHAHCTPAQQSCCIPR